MDNEIKKAILEIAKNTSLLKEAILEKQKGTFLLKEEKNFNKELEFLKKEKQELKEEITEIEQIKSDLTYRVTKQDQELKILEKDRENLREEIQKIEKTKNSLMDELTLYKISFEKELAHYKLYCQLNQSTKDSLKGIFKTYSLQGFLAAGVQERNISSLWDYIHTELKEGRNKNIQPLKKLFYLFFEKYILAYPLYELQNVQVGDDFDIDEHIKDTRSSSVNGLVQEVVFKGWINKKTGKSIKKTIVKVK